MRTYIFTVLAIDEDKRPADSSYGFSFELRVEASNEDEARKIGISQFCEENPNRNINDYITDIATI